MNRKTTIKLFLPALCILFSPLANAQTGWKPNWLFGTSWGYFDRNGVMKDVLNHINQSYNVKLRNTNALFGLFTGYQWQCNQWLVGGELNVSWYADNQQTTYIPTGYPIHASYRRNIAYTLSGRLGFQWWGVLPYLRAGVETSNESLSIMDDSLFVAANATNGQVYRFVGGLGVELPLVNAQNISFRLEYLYHTKGRNMNLYTSNTIFGTYYSDSFSTKQYVNTATANIVWNFNL